MKFWKYIKYKLSNSDDNDNSSYESSNNSELVQDNNIEKSNQNTELQNNDIQDQIEEDSLNKSDNQASQDLQFSSNIENNSQESLNNNSNMNNNQESSSDSQLDFNSEMISPESSSRSSQTGNSNDSNSSNNSSDQSELDQLQDELINQLLQDNIQYSQSLEDNSNSNNPDDSNSDLSKNNSREDNNGTKSNGDFNQNHDKSSQGINDNTKLNQDNNIEKSNQNTELQNNNIQEQIEEDSLNKSDNQSPQENNQHSQSLEDCSNNLENSDSDISKKNSREDNNGTKSDENKNSNTDTDNSENKDNVNENSDSNIDENISDEIKSKDEDVKSTEENNKNNKNSKKIDLLRKLSDKLKKYKVKKEKAEKRKKEYLNPEKKDVEESIEEKYELSDQTNKFLDELKDLPSFDERNRGNGYSIDTNSYTEVPESVIRTLITKFLNQRFCKRNSDLNTRSNSLEKAKGFYKWEVKDVITHLETHQVTKVLTDKYGYQYAEGKVETVPLSFYFDLSGSMSKYTNMLAVIAIELLKKDVKVLLGYNQKVNVQIDKIDKTITIDELVSVIESAGYYSDNNYFKKNSKVIYKFINRNIDNYLIEKKSEKCVVFADFDPRYEVINLSQKVDVYWFCFENNFGKYDISNYCGFIYKVCNLEDLEQGLIKVNQKRFETLCYTENPINLQGKVRVKK